MMKLSAALKIPRVGLKMDPEVWSPDYIARTVIVQAYLYYVLDSPTMADGEWDRRVRFVIDNWERLHEDRKWCLRSADELRATGHRIRFTSHAADAALNHHKYATGEALLIWRDDWRYRKKDGCRYVTTAHSPISMDEYLRRIARDR